jgi:hypothetical protein
MKIEPIIIKITSIVTGLAMIVGFLPLKAEAVALWPTPPNPPDIAWRLDIQPGDILYDKDAVYSSIAGVFTIGHTAMYVGDLNIDGQTKQTQEIESLFKKGVTNDDISTWDYPHRDNVYLIRVNTTDAIKENAVSFVANQLDKPYDWHWWQKSADPNSPSWYCSELDWAAYFNQGIDLEHHTALEKAQPDLETPYVSPAEIFADEDTYVVSSHSTGFLDRFQGIVFMAFSPVDIQLTAPDGAIINKTENQIPGAYYIEDYQFDNGEVADLIVLPEGAPFGQYSVLVTPEPDAPPGSTYSLEVYRGSEGTSELIVQDQPVPTQSQSDSYNFSIGHSGSFYDTETSTGDTFQAGSIDFSLQSSGFSGNITLSNPAGESVSVLNNGSLDFQYKISATDFSGDLCNYLNLSANLDGNPKYNGPLTSFVNFNVGQFLAPENWAFTLNLSSSNTSLQGKNCSFKFVFDSWQTNLPDNTQGFVDSEEITNTVWAGYWSPPVVLNEILPNPLGDDCSLTGLNGEWVEIYNKTANQLDLAGWYIQDAANHQIVIQNLNTMSGSTIIGANGSGQEWMVVFMNSCILNNDTDTVMLFDDNSIQVDSYTYAAPQNNINNTPGATNNLAAYLPFDGNLQDLSGNNNNGTNYGASFVAGKVNQGLSFDGGSYVEVGDSSSLQSSAISIEAWVNQFGSPGSYKYIIAKHYASGYASYGLYTGSSGGLRFYIGHENGFVLSPDAGTGIWDGNWHHIVGIYDGSNVRLYVDGAEISSGTPTTKNIAYNNNDLYIGSYGTGYYFTGLIDEIKVYNRALSSQEVLDHYNAATPTGQVPEFKSYARIPDGSPNWVDPYPTPGGPNILFPESEPQTNEPSQAPENNNQDTEDTAINQETNATEDTIIQEMTGEIISEVASTTTSTMASSTASTTPQITEEIIPEPTSSPEEAVVDENLAPVTNQVAQQEPTNQQITDNQTKGLVEEAVSEKPEQESGEELKNESVKEPASQGASEPVSQPADNQQTDGTIEEVAAELPNEPTQQIQDSPENDVSSPQDKGSQNTQGDGALDQGATTDQGAVELDSTTETETQ